MHTSSDLSRRVLVIAGAIGASLLPRAIPARAQDAASTADTADTADAEEGVTRPATEEECALAGTVTTVNRCIAWEESEVCPDGEELRRELVEPDDRGWGGTVRPQRGPGVYADGECCYVVTITECAMGCGCAHGRPLRVEGRPRRAGVSQGDPPRARPGPWLDPRQARPRLDGLTPAERAQLAHLWASVALNEHASIHSFLAAGRDLRRLGLPRRLLRAYRRAAAYEVRHARAAFTLASAFAGASVAPAARRPARPAPAGDLPELVRRTVADGCIDETLAVSAAMAMRDAATGPAVHLVLTRVAADELRHAELAWRTLGALLTHGDSPTRAASLAAARATFREHRPSLGRGSAPPRLAAWGHVGDTRLADAARSVWRHTVAPAATALTGPPPPTPAR